MKILFVYSSLDEDSKSIFKEISQIEELKKVTLPIDASHPHINSILKTSTNIKIAEIPTIINYGSPDGKVLKYEGVESVTGFINDVVNNLSQHEKQAEDSSVAITNISDLDLDEDNEEEEPTENFAPQVTRLAQPKQSTSVQPQIQNMPIKNKRGAAQSKKIESFRSQREAPVKPQVSDNSDPSRIKITSPPMTR